MQWLQGPINDQAIFWLGIKVFWWKRFITFCQLLLASSIFLNLMTAERKRRLHRRLVELQSKNAGIAVPPVIQFRTLVKWFLPIIVGLAVLLGILMHYFVTVNHQPISILSASLGWVILLVAFSLPIGQIIFTLSMLRSGYRGLQRYAPPVLAWLLHYERFDRNVTIMVFGLLALVTALQIWLS